ncbi:HEPN domain-containing protein [Candidatus Pyrohabitans sp.]
MDEIDVLLKKSEDRLKAAEILLGEGYYEDAISRAYYSMFFAAKALLKTKEIDAKTHRGVISKFGLEFVQKDIIERKYGKAIHEAEELREEADYSIFRPIYKEEAEFVIDAAEKFLNRIKKAINDFRENTT